jgi:hypothetical protein
MWRHGVQVNPSRICLQTCLLLGVRAGYIFRLRAFCQWGSGTVRDNDSKFLQPHGNGGGSGWPQVQSYQYWIVRPTQAVYLPYVRTKWLALWLYLSSSTYISKRRYSSDVLEGRNNITEIIMMIIDILRRGATDKVAEADPATSVFCCMRNNAWSYGDGSLRLCLRRCRSLRCAVGLVCGIQVTIGRAWGTVFHKWTPFSFLLEHFST